VMRLMSLRIGPLALLGVLLLGCGSHHLVRTKAPIDNVRSPWVGTWSNDEYAHVRIFLSLTQGGRFDYAFCPSLSTAPNSSVLVYGIWSVRRNLLQLNCLRLAYDAPLIEIRNRQPYDYSTRLTAISRTIDSRITNDGRTIVIPFQFDVESNLKTTLFHRYKDPRPIDWKRIEASAEATQRRTSPSR
jgi:hypothetical protein